MDAELNAAARALAEGDALGALNRVSLRADAPALALRGIAMAQLGDHERARRLLKQAARCFGARAPLAQARCVVAEAEVCLAQRELGAWPRSLDTALRQLEAQGEMHNVVHGRLLFVRRSILLGRLDAATDTLSQLALERAPAASAAIAELCRSEIELRRLRVRSALAALARAGERAAAAKIPALRREVQAALHLAEQPAARLGQAAQRQLLTLLEVEQLFASSALIVDGCRRILWQGSHHISLARRPILLALLVCLAEHPEGASREQLMVAAFEVDRPNESHRARLRVEIGRLRKKVSPLCGIEATPQGFRLVPKAAPSVKLLLPPIEGGAGALLALLADGLPWSTSALGLALGESQRNVQRALAELEAQGKARSVGRGRSQRWLAPPLTAVTTTLLLPFNVAGG